MKRLMVFILMISFSGLFVACNKPKDNLPHATEIPNELSYLKGSWKVVDFDIDNGWGSVPPNAEPDFDAVNFTNKKATFYYKEHKVKSEKFIFTKDEKSEIYQFYLHCFCYNFNFNIFYQSDTLHLLSTIMDGGTSYRLVKEE